ncbi:MAG: 30S ribosomal protein S1, partial [Clostridiales bacterium]|nr:30S ribosomal protein S1 [Clostridiales bacterium]
GNMSSFEKSEEIKTEKNNDAENPTGETAEPLSDKSDTDDAAKIIKKTSTTIKRTGRTPVIAIDERLVAQTDEEKLRDNLIDLVESLKSNVLLSGTVQGVEQSPNNPYSLAVIYHGEFKILIPANEFMEEPDDTHDQPKETVLNYMMTRRMGAEVDYVIKGIDANARIAAASRLEAMRIKRRQYYFATDRDGNNIIHSGINAEARVVSVIRAGIFVDLFGLETYIPLKELSYQRLLDAASQFQTGQRILVKILEVERKNHDVRVLASVKQATENPYEKALRKYSVGNKYVGTVSLVDTNGVFVALDGGIDCLCAYPKRGRPPRGARATVRIIGINYEANRIWGAITHISAPR